MKPTHHAKINQSIKQKTEGSGKMCDPVDFDKAILLTGYGKFHYEAFTACAICIICVGFQNGLAAYIFPAAQCELRLTSFELSLLNVGFLVGGVLSSFLWGVLADAKGRRSVLVFTHLANASVTVLGATNGSMVGVILCRFFNGFLIGGPGSIVFSYLGEFQPAKCRSSVICYSGVFFTGAWLLLPLLAWIVLPMELSFSMGSFFIVTPWRLFMLILVVPEVLVGFWFLRLPESPKFFLARGDSTKALLVLRKIFATNTGQQPEDFPVKTLLKQRNENPLSRQCKGKVQEMYNQFKSLFKPPLLIFTLLSTSIMFANMFGVFGLGWWLPELFVRFERFHHLHPNRTVTVKELALLNDTKTCKPSFEPAVIESTVIMGVTSLVANAASGWLAARIPLKVIPCATMSVGGLSAMVIFWLSSAWQNLVVASVFQAAMVTANMTIGGVVVELFPTGVGAMAICLTMCAGRVGAMASNLVFGLWMDRRCEIPIFVVAGSVLIGAGLCFFIPRGSGGEREKRKVVEVAVVTHFDTKL
ncbi:synaptic vesicle glycoprotein 2A-like [Zophobas morio]|uniref:synaptic vesicle glycoprotein 2A-like n=1 Tax=Zophobas morio TaxID=2755281 RepID=UPI003083D9A3